MPIRTGLGLVICGLALAACAANGPKGPAATVTTPAVGHPPAPSSVAAAMSSEVFTPYAALGASPNDGLAPGDTYDALHTACMNDAGYGQYAAQAPYPASWPEAAFRQAAARGAAGPARAPVSPAGRSATCPPGRKRPRASAPTSWRTSTTPSSLTP